MRRLACFLPALFIAFAAASASASIPVTTGETDSGDPPSNTVLIVDPIDGAVFPGSPNAIVPVTIEFESPDNFVELRVDDEVAGSCDGQPSPCKLDVELTPGSHNLTASVLDNAHSIMVSVEESSEETDTDATTGDTTGDTTSDASSSATEPTGGEQPGSTTDATGTDGPDTTSDGGGEGDGDKGGCDCSASGGAPDVVGLALLGLLAPWRRRRRA